MRVPLGWLAEYVDIDWPVDELAARLTALGMQVEGIDRIGSDWSNVVVGELLEVRPHPHASRLSLTRVTVGDGGAALDIVCGATNISAGQRIPVALPGAVLPGGRRIERTEIQGAPSMGMLCSPDELNLGADADGILILDSSAPLGAALEELVGETVLDIDVKPNRGDLLSLIGVAREVAALTGASVRWPDVSVDDEGDATTDHLSVEIQAADLCSRFVARYVDRVSVRPSPVQVQLRLAAAGMRPVSNIVDASNYVMLEMGKPIHTFDAAAVTDGRIVVRRAGEGESLQTLDHATRELATEDLLIADPDGPLGLAGVMGGASSEVGPETTAVAIESAIFDPVAIRRTAQRHALRSEASQRFERGQEWRLARLGADRTAQLLARWAGGRVARGVIDTDDSARGPAPVPFRPARVNRLLGARIEAERMREILASVEIATEPADPATSAAVPIIATDPVLDTPADNETLVALVPTHRRDIAIEADVAEEVARLHGYENLPTALPASQTPAHRPDPRRFIDQLRELLAARGLSEMVSYVLIGPDDHAQLGYETGDAATIRVANPISADHSEMRRSMLPGLLNALSLNERHRRQDVALFEIGPVHEYRDGQPWQSNRLALILAGAWQAAGWAGGARESDVADAKGLLEWAVERLCHRRVSYRQPEVQLGIEHPGRTAQVLVDNAGEPKPIGMVGELDPRYLRTAGIRSERAVVAVLELAPLEALYRARPAPILGRGPLLERDIAVVADEDTASASVERAIRQAAGSALVDAYLFDRYQGPPLGQDEVSLAYRLVLESPDAADGAQAEASADAVVAAVTADLRIRLGLRIRGLEEDDGR